MQVFPKAVSDCLETGCGEKSPPPMPGLLLSSVRTCATKRALKEMKKNIF